MSTEQRKLAQAVADELFGTLEQVHDSDNGVYYITLPNSVRFCIRSGGWNKKGRITVSDRYPEHVTNERGATGYTAQGNFAHDQDTLSEITIADTKTPAQIASDIKRRFLAEYIPLYIKAVQFCKEQAVYWDEFKDTQAAIRSAVLGTGISVSYFGKEYANLEITAGPALTKMIADVVRKYKATV